MKNEGIIVCFGIVVLAVVITLITLSSPYEDILELIVRLTALHGYLCLCVAAVITPFVKETTRMFGASFIRMHHKFSILGLTLATVHPVSQLIRSWDLSIFLPDFQSWYGFWSLAGRPALIILYIAFSGVLLRKKIRRYWRTIHMLVYIVLFFGIVHANLIGSDFTIPVITAMFNTLFVSSMVAFVLKRWQRNKIRKILSARRSSQ